MAQTWTHSTNLVSQIKLPSGSVYYLKDSDARAILDTYATGTSAAGRYSVTSTVANNTNLPTAAAVKTYVDGQIATIHNFTYQIVSALPAATAANLYKIFLVEDATSTTGSYVEYLLVEDPDHEGQYKWEKIGTTTTDLSNYAMWGTYPVSVTYVKPPNATGNAGGVTVQGSNFSFSGTAGTVTVSATIVTGVTTTAADTSSITYATGVSTKTFHGTAATIKVSSHTHSIPYSMGSVTVVNSVPTTSKTFLATASMDGSVAEQLNLGTGTVTGINGSIGTATPSFVGSIGDPQEGTQTAATSSAGAQDISYTPAGTLTVSLSTTSKTFVTSAIKSATATTGSKSMTGSFTPAGTIGGSQAISSHTHSITGSNATASGTATLASS